LVKLREGKEIGERRGGEESNFKKSLVASFIGKH
jgi:hypothetical protein